MAHQSDVYQVRQAFPSSGEELVTDPVCGMTLRPKEVKTMLFRGDNSYSFCSKECQRRFIAANPPQFTPIKKEAA